MKFLGLILIAFPLFASATIYQVTDSQGNVFYTDQPSENATPVEMDPTNVIPKNVNPAPNKAKPAKKEEDETIPEGETSKNYEDLKIAEPVDQATIWNQPNITVNLDVKPKLFKGDKAALFLDGKKVVEAETTQFFLNHPDRGQHSVQAKIFGSNGSVKKESNTITIFVHYGTVNQQGGAR